MTNGSLHLSPLSHCTSTKINTWRSACQGREQDGGPVGDVQSDVSPPCHMLPHHLTGSAEEYCQDGTCATKGRLALQRRLRCGARWNWKRETHLPTAGIPVFGRPLNVSHWQVPSGGNRRSVSRWKIAARMNSCTFR